MFEGFVEASVTAIESRDPTTSGHSRRVATHVGGAGEEGRRASPTGRWRASTSRPTHLQQLEYAGVLHDFGKVGVRERVLVKAKKLYEEDLRNIKLRFAYIKKGARGRARRAQAARRAGAGQVRPARRASPSIDAELGRRMDEVDEALAFVRARQRADGAGSGRVRAAGGDRAPRLHGARRRAAAVPRARGGRGAAGAARQPDRGRARRDRAPRRPHHEVPAGDPVGPPLRRRAAHRRRPPRVPERQRLSQPAARARTSRSNRAS